MLARRLAGSVAQAREAHGIEPVALIIATGNIVELGNKKQYQAAGTFFTALAEALEISPARLLFVPGNHDVSWAHCERTEADQKIYDFDHDELERHIHLDKLAPYRDFQSAFYKCAPAALTSGYYVEPTIFEGKSRMRIFQEKFFGPVVSVTRLSTPEEVLGMNRSTWPITAAGSCRRAGCRPTVSTCARRMRPLAVTSNGRRAREPQDDAGPLPVDKERDGEPRPRAHEPVLIPPRRRRHAAGSAPAPGSDFAWTDWLGLSSHDAPCS